jgi:hypothetical protein
MGDETHVTFSGGSPTVGAIGQHAKGRIEYGRPADPRLTDIDRRLTELRALLDQHAAELTDAAGAREAVDAATTELRAERPEPGRVRLFLNSVAGAAPGVAAVTQAVRELVQLISTVLS